MSATLPCAPHVIKFEDARARTAVDGGDASEAKRLNEAANKDCVSHFGMAREVRETERAHVLEAVASECARFAAITKGYVFGSFARGDFAAESDVDVRLEYDGVAPSPCSRCPSSKSTSNAPAGAPSTW